MPKVQESELGPAEEVGMERNVTLPKLRIEKQLRVPMLRGFQNRVLS